MRLEQGASREVITNELKNAGWKDSDLMGLFEPSNTPIIQEQKSVPIVPPVEQIIPGEVKTNIQKIPTSEKIGKFKASRMIVSGSWNLLKQDKEMMLFPVYSIVINFLVALVLMTLFFFIVFNGDWKAVEAMGESSTINGIWYVFIFILYIISYFIVTFFEIGIVAIAHGRINGQNLSFRDGLAAASSRSGKILVWSVLAATVGMVLRTIAERSKILGGIVVWMLGAMWSILTYFIVPVLFLEDLSIKQSLKRSAQVINTSWGEAAIVNVGVGLVFFFLGLAGVVLLIGLLVVLMTMTESVAVPLIVGGIFIFYLLLLAVISSTLGTIFKVVLYEYATKRTVPQGFSEELFYNAFKTKKTKKS